MSYSLARYRAPARRYPMAGIAEWFGGGSQDSAEQVRCLNKANSSTQVRAIEGEISRLRREWNPTGFYLPSDIRGVIAKLKEAAAEAGDALKQAPMSTGDARSIKDEAFERAAKQIRDKAAIYEDAIAESARAGKEAVYAPSFKKYVLDSMQEIANVYITATVLHCRQTWVEKWLNKGYSTIAQIGAYVAKIVGYVGNLAKAGFDWIAFILKYAPYAAAGAGAWFVYSNFIKEK